MKKHDLSLMSLRKNSNRHYPPFTLVELLVIIAIIAILASILMPALKKAKDKATEIECAGKLKQIGIATHFYINDTGYYLPAQWTPYIPKNTCWYLLSEYLAVKNYSQLADMSGPGKPAHCPAYNGSDVNYVYNYYLKNPDHALTDGIPLHSKKVSEASRTVLFFDGTGAIFGNKANTDYRHRRKLNSLFCDGHIKLYNINFQNDPDVIWQP